MMIKRPLQFLAPVVLVVALGACGSDSKSSSTTAATTTAAAATTVDTTLDTTLDTSVDATLGTTATGGSSATGDSDVASTVTGDSTATDDSVAADAGTGEGTDFCDTNKQVLDSLSAAESAEEGLAALKQLDSTFDTYLTQAPAAYKADATAFVSAARKAVAGNDANIFVNDAGVEPAVTGIASYCGYDLG